MNKPLACLVALGTLLHLESSYARQVTGAASCPQTMSIDSLLKIAAKEVKSTVDWGDTEWTLHSKGGDFPSVGIEQYVISMENPKNESGLLFCSYRITSHNPKRNAMITLSTEYTGPI